MNLRKPLLVAVVLLVAIGAVLSFALPGLILHLIQHPDGSYLSVLLQKHQLKNPELHTVEFYSVFIPQVVRRLLLVATFLLVAFALLATRFRAQTLAFWNHRSTPLNLAILRVVILSQVLLYSFDQIYDLPHLTFAGMNIPFAYGWTRAFMPPSMELITVAMWAFKILAFAVLFGVGTRFTLPLLLGVSFFTMLGPQFVGKMNHYHHLWLGLAVLTLGPCADALSIDAWWKKRQGRGVDWNLPSRIYGLPFVFLWLIMGMTYFFPGYWKFVVGGLDWAFSDNIQLKILAKAFETGQEPFFPLYQYPWLCKLGGMATIIFEMGFPFAMIFPSGRLLFGIGGLGFHEINRQVMQIAFTPLEWYYTSFVNWSAWLGRKPKTPTEDVSAPAAWKKRVGVVLVAGLVLTGFLEIESWPWACYPTFAALEQPFVNSIELQIENADGKIEQRLLLQDDANLIRAYSDRTRLRAYFNLVMLQSDPGERDQMLHGLFDIWKGSRELPGGTRYHFWMVKVPLWPRAQPNSPYKELGEIRP
jgi:hypothetical protein